MPGVAFGILGPIAETNIDVDMIIQNQSKGRHHRFLLHSQSIRVQQSHGTGENTIAPAVGAVAV